MMDLNEWLYYVAGGIVGSVLSLFIISAFGKYGGTVMFIVMVLLCLFVMIKK